MPAVFDIVPFYILYPEVCNVPETKQLNDRFLGLGRVSFVKVEFMSLQREMSLWFLNVLC